MTATPGFILYDGTGGIAVYLFPVPEVPPLPFIFYAVLHFFSSSRFNLLLALLVLLLLQLFCAYDFLYAEQFCFFRFSADYAASMLLHPGGAVEYAAQFLGQFYYYRWAGPFIASLLFFLMAEGLSVLSHRRCPFFCVAAALLVAVLETVVHYPMAATLSILAAVWLTVVYLRMGSVLESRLSAPWNHWQYFFRLIFYLILYYWLAGYGWAPAKDALHTWTLSRYATSFLQVPAAAHLLPVCYVVVLLLAFGRRWRTSVLIDDWLTRGRRWRGVSLRSVVVDVAQILLAFCLVAIYYVQTHPADECKLKRLDVMRWHEQWNRILLEPLPTWERPVYACYKNLALASRGKLGESLNLFPQGGPEGLWMPWRDTRQQADLLADIFWVQGNVAMAQKMAFNAMSFHPSGLCPRHLLRLAETNLVMGNDAVAEKYLNLLDDTFVYADQARCLRKFVGHPERLKADARLSMAHRCLTTDELLTNDELGDLRPIMAANPAARGARDYYGAYLLLSGQLEEFRYFIDHYCIFPFNPASSDAAPLRPAEAYADGLPRSFQEALVMMLDEADDVRYGINPEVRQDFSAFRQLLENSGGNVSAIPERFYSTYWFYSFTQSKAHRQ